MNNIQGIPAIDGLLDSLNYVEDVFWYEGPLLSKFVDGDGNPYLFSWVDCCQDKNRWLVWKSSESEIQKFLNNECELWDLMKSENYFICVDSSSEAGPYSNVKYALSKDIPNDYLPSGKHF